MNKIYLSTGAFINRVNNRNWHLLTQYHDKIDCDGFEFMIYEAHLEKFDEIVKEYLSENINIPVVHALKNIGDNISDPDCLRQGMDLMKLCCEKAAMLGAKKIVVHCWGIPLSDKYFSILIDRIGLLKEVADGYGLDFLPENSFCVHGSPYDHFVTLSEKYPDLGFIVDTRCAQFHSELETFVTSPLLTEGKIRHFHLNDYDGGYKDWNAMYPIPQPGEGRIDWDLFFNALRGRYDGSFTLEAPSALPDGIDDVTFNKSIAFIKSKLL